MRKSLLSTAIVLLFVGYSFALPTPGPKAKPPGNLEVIIVASDSVQYIKDWLDPSMESRVVVPRVNKVKPEQVAYCAFLITGLTPSPNPYSSLQYSVGFNLFSPSGELLFNVPEYTRGQVKNPGKPILIMADPALDLVLEESDPEGTYTLEAHVVDMNTGKAAKGSYQITLVK